MINGNLDEFLDLGWLYESTLYYKNRIYWCEGFFENDIHYFFVSSWFAKNEDNLYYHSLIDQNGDPIGYCISYKIHGKDINLIKQKFLTAPIFDGKSFWEVEPELAWLEEGKPILIEDIK